MWQTVRDTDTEKGGETEWEEEGKEAESWRARESRLSSECKHRLGPGSLANRVHRSGCGDTTRLA